jgi:hypothetical protein
MPFLWDFSISVIPFPGETHASHRRKTVDNEQIQPKFTQAML